MKCKINHSHWLDKREVLSDPFTKSKYTQNNEDVDIISIMPAYVKNNAEIKSQIIQHRIDKDEVSEEEVFEFCKDKGEYWLYNNF